MNQVITIDESATQLNVLEFPLSGSHLIEASAGTGKTYTIALLYVRLVLGHGRENPSHPGLTPPEILVMTFTETATQELRDRIRARLTEAAEFFRQDPNQLAPSPQDEDPLHALRGRYKPEEWPACARKLQLAAEWMDEAAVSTIHAWCYRMLREHAFDSGSLFSQQLETDQSELYAEIVRDYWRTFLTPLTDTDAREVYGWWKDPGALEKKLKPLTSYPELFPNCSSPERGLQECREKKNQTLTELKRQPWETWIGELQELLTAAYEKNHVNRRQIQPRFFNPWLEALRVWSTTTEADSLDLKKGWERLTPEGVKAVWTVGNPPAHVTFQAIKDLKRALETLPNASIHILHHAAHWVSERLALEQARRAQMGFNDLLTRLRDALNGPNSERLIQLIRKQFPAALIDEFQDTDPVQYEIFDRIYQVESNHQDTTLILIGDPKQAIYAFRGADIHTYLQAREATAGRRHILKINHRSSKAMIQCSNAWFELAEKRPEGPGAFLFRQSDTENPLPFVSAVAKGLKNGLQVKGQEMDAMTLWWLPGESDKPISKELFRNGMANYCAAEIVRLLNLAQGGQAGFVEEGNLKPLMPADMAVLVNSRTEANIIRKAMQQRGLRSVYLSDQDSVYDTQEAADLLFWLRACAEPGLMSRIRAALATGTLALSWKELDKINTDEAHAEAKVDQFRQYQACWKKQGVLAMIRKLMDDFGVPARLTGSSSLDGERKLTDLLHLAELMQQASTKVDGEHALIRFLAENIEEAGDQGARDARQIRLESDADLVKVVTVHKSKGLEYPLVFLPFAADFRALDEKKLPWRFHNDQNQLELALAATDEALEKSDHERLAEELRKMYVAMTRAVHATWVGVVPISKAHKGALGYLLTGGHECSPSELGKKLEALKAVTAGMGLMTIDSASETGETFKPSTPPVLGEARASKKVSNQNWWAASYSALKTPGGRHSYIETAAQANFEEDQDLDEQDSSEQSRNAAPVLFPHTFPKGATPGTFLHDLFEWAAREGFSTVSSNPDRLREKVTSHCQTRGWDKWIEPLTGWLDNWIKTPLNLRAQNGMAASTLRLADLTRLLPEMEFWISCTDVSTDKIDTLLLQHTLEGSSRPSLQPNTLNGMLKGFMDLVFEHEGRYYVLDYKSNMLGTEDAAYTTESLQKVILDNRYELQYALYLLALHRHLKSRLPDYDYDRHMGGAVYLFLRGLNSDCQGLHVERPPVELIEALDCLFSPTLTKAA